MLGHKHFHLLAKDLGEHQASVQALFLFVFGNNLDRFNHGVHTKMMKLNRDKCKVLHRSTKRKISLGILCAVLGAIF